MNQLIACALCAGEIKKVGFQVDASVNASAANFPILNIYSRSRFTLAISIIAICSWPIIVVDTRGRSAYVWVITRANCTTLRGRHDIARNPFILYPPLVRQVFIALLGDSIKAIKITFLSRANFDLNRCNLRKNCATKNFEYIWLLTI